MKIRVFRINSCVYVENHTYRIIHWLEIINYVKTWIIKNVLYVLLKYSTRYN